MKRKKRKAKWGPSRVSHPDYLKAQEFENRRMALIDGLMALRFPFPWPRQKDIVAALLSGEVRYCQHQTYCGPCVVFTGSSQWWFGHHELPDYAPCCGAKKPT